MKEQVLLVLFLGCFFVLVPCYSHAVPFTLEQAVSMLNTDLQKIETGSLTTDDSNNLPKLLDYDVGKQTFGSWASAIASKMYTGEFTNFDQKTNQLFNLIATVLKNGKEKVLASAERSAPF